MDSLEARVYGTNKETLHRKEEIKCYNKIKQYEKILTMTMLQKKR